MRWYGDNFKVNSFYIEKKIKENFLSKKKRQKINLKKEINLFNENDRSRYLINNINSDYDPIVFINYNRLYFVSDLFPIRATIDYNLSSVKFIDKKLNTEKNIFKNIILELKYDLNFDDEFRSKINKLNLRFSKNSKYVNSVLDYPDFFLFIKIYKLLYFSNVRLAHLFHENNLDLSYPFKISFLLKLSVSMNFSHASFIFSI